MSILQNYTKTNREKDVIYLLDQIEGNCAVGVVGQVMLIDSDGDEITSFGGSGAGGGDTVYSNASGDFVATTTDDTKNITITGLPFTLEDIHVAGGFIKKISSAGVVTDLSLSNVEVAGGVITLDDIDDFATGDTVLVAIVGPDKAYDVDLDNRLVSVQNPDYAHYTDVEHLIDEEDLSFAGTHDGGDGVADFEDSGETYTAETVAEGYTIYNVTDGSDAVIDSGGAGNPAGGDIAHAALANGTDDDWDDDDVASIPEVKRFEIPMDSYKHLAIHYKLDANDEHNSCYMKIYGTLNEDADTTDDTDWVDMSVDLLTGLDGFDTDHVEADGIGDGDAATAEDIVFIDTSTMPLKFMIKIVAECDDGNEDNDFNVYIRKYY